MTEEAREQCAGSARWLGCFSLKPIRTPIKWSAVWTLSCALLGIKVSPYSLHDPQKKTSHLGLDWNCKESTNSFFISSESFSDPNLNKYIFIYARKKNNSKSDLFFFFVHRSIPQFTQVWLLSNILSRYNMKKKFFYSFKLLKVMSSYLFGGDPLPSPGLSLLNLTILVMCLDLTQND